MQQITIHALLCDSLHDAIQMADASGLGEPVLIDKPMGVPQADLDRLAVAGVEFATLHNHQMPGGSYRIMTVPVN